MAIYTVFHFMPLDAWPRSQVFVHHFPSGYLKVAEVECDHPEEAYRLTNHIEIPWQRNKGVKAFHDRARSTSPGDIIVTTSGDKLYVAWAGMWPLHQRWWWPFSLEGSSDNRRTTAQALLADWMSYQRRRLCAAFRVPEHGPIWIYLVTRYLHQTASGKHRIGPAVINLQRWMVGERRALSFTLSLWSQRMHGTAYWGKGQHPGQFESQSWQGQCGVRPRVATGHVQARSARLEPEQYPDLELKISILIFRWSWRITWKPAASNPATVALSNADAALGGQ